jgi:hypothetical protein
MQLLKLRLVEGNDDVVALTATRDGQPINLTGVALEVYLKTTEYEADADALLLSSGGGQITVTDAAAGLSEAVVDGTLIVPELTWWRYDVIESGARHTVSGGPLEVINV